MRNPPKPNAGLPCAARDYFATEAKARACFRVQRGTWTAEPCECGGWHIARPARKAAG
jgi:hypothetical protein